MALRPRTRRRGTSVIQLSTKSRNRYRIAASSSAVNEQTQAARHTFPQGPRVDASRTLVCAARIEHRRQPLQGIQLGAEHNSESPLCRVLRHTSEIGNQVQWQIQPKQDGRHAFEKRPYHVAVSVIDGEIALLSRDSRSDVVHNRLRDVPAAVAAEPRTECKVDIFQVAEESLVESADLLQDIPAIQ